MQDEKEKILKKAAKNPEKLAALTALFSMPQHTYEEWLADLIVKYYRPGFDYISFNITDKNRISLIRFIVLLNAKFKEKGMVVPLLKIAHDTVDTEAGFVLLNEDARIDCTLDALLLAKEPLLLSHV